MRPSKVMANALSATFHRMTHRAMPRPVGSSDLVTRYRHFRAACSVGKCPRARTARISSRPGLQDGPVFFYKSQEQSPVNKIYPSADEALKGVVMRLPTREEIQPIANEQAVVEFYSR